VNADPPVFRQDAIGAEATRAIAARLAAALRDAPVAATSPVLVTLEGDLGAGKTTFVGGLLQAFGHAGPARSPTYTLIEPYRFAGREVHHCDLYRLRHPDELEDLGLRDLRRPGSLLLVEWPEKAEGRLGTPDVAVRLDYRGPDARSVEIAPHSEAGRQIVDRF
jgi:tRNA threonylcarbamoyladenosine biosynthesis protein TsaE